MARHAKSHTIRRVRVGVVLGLAVAGVTACSFLVNTDTVSCKTDADCAKLTGAKCDVQNSVCIAGTPALVDSGNPLDSSVDSNDGGFTLPEAALPDGDTDSSDGGGLVDATIDAPETSTDAGPTEPDWNRVSTYLQSLYDPGQRMVRRWPSSSEFWTTNDNILAARALAYLPTPQTSMSNSILARLAGLRTCGCGDDFGHTADINHLVDPVVHKGAKIDPTPRGACFGEPTEIGSCVGGFDAGGAIICSATVIRTEDHANLGWGSDQCNVNSCGGTSYGNWNDQGQGNGFADLIALEILSYRNRGVDPSAVYANLLTKWDGRGMRDTVTAGDSTYQTYKLALFRLVSNVLGKPIPVGVDAILTQAQGLNGGIRTSYALDGTFSLDQAGSAEATAYVVLAFLKPVGDY